MEPKTPSLSEAGDIESPGSVSSGVEVDIMSEDEEQERPVSQLSLSRMLQDPPPSPSILEACKEGSPDSVSSGCQPENMSISVSAARSRAWSPQPSTSSGQRQPFVKLEKWTDQLSSGSTQSFRSSWADKPQLSTSCSSLLQERELQPFFDPYDETEDHIYARDLSMRRSPMDWQERSPSPQPSSSSGGVPFIKQPFVQASNATEADSTDPDHSLSPENISVPAAVGQPRTWSQQPTQMSDVTLKDSEIPVLSLADNFTGSMLSNTEFIDYSKVDRDISLPVKKRLRRWSKSQWLPTTKTEEASSMDSDAQNTSAPPAKMRLRRWPSEHLTTPEQTQLEMQNLGEGDDATSASDLSGVPQNLSIAASEAKKRALSPQPSTSKGRMELKGKPLSAVIGSKGDSFSLSVLKNIRAIEEKRKMHQLSPRLVSTPTPMQLVKAEAEKPADAGSSSAAQKISAPASETKKRPRSPQSPTPTEDLEDKEKPLLTIGSKGDSFSLSVLKNIRAIEEKRKMHQLSPRLVSTPTPMQSVKAEAEKPADAGSSNAAQKISAPASETKKRPRSPQSPTPTEDLEDKEKPLLTIGSKGDSFSLSVLKNISAIVEKRKKHQLSPRLISASAPMQSVKAEEEQPADDGSSSTAQNLSAPASETKKRPRSPQSPTSTEDLEVKEKPLLTIGSKGDSFSLSVLKNISAIVEQRKTRQISQQTSTSPTPMQSPEPEEEKPADDGSAIADQDINAPADEEMDRPPSPRSPTPEALIEIKKVPLSAAIGSKGDSFSLSVLKNISAIVEQRRKRQVPLRPSTPPAPMLSPKADDEEPADDGSAIAAQNISVPDSETMRPSSPQSPTPSAELSIMEAIESKTDSADSFSMSGLQNISVTATETRRPRSPQSPTPSAALLPIMEAIESKADAFSMSVLQNISVIVADRNRRQLSMLTTLSAPIQPVEAEDEQRSKRQVPPQTSTPSAPTQSPKAADGGSSSAAQNISVLVGEGIAPEPSSSIAASKKEPALMNPADSVYAHVPYDLSNIQQLTGLKAGRRHGRLRRLHALKKIRERYGPMIDCVVPLVVESSAKHQSQLILITSALDHFATTVNNIVDTHEGRDTTNFTERLEAFKKRMEARCEKRRQRNQEEPEEPQPPMPDLSDEETLKRLRQETDAAVEALLTGDKSKEYPPDRYEELMKLFRDAYINTQPK